MTPNQGGRLPTRARWLRPLCLLVVTLALVAEVPAYASGATTSTTQAKGPVNVLYPGSLVQTMEQVIGPRFDAATGYTFTGFSAGSDALATQIKDGVQKGDVFISASPDVNQELQGAANGNWVTWYITFATAPLVIGYNPKSTFAHDLKTKPWPQVVLEPGFLLGRTDPATDPKGKLAVTAMQQAAKRYKLPAFTALAATDTGEFPEETLVGRLQAGQLDAGFFYSAEAKAAGIPTVSLGPIKLSATYTVTALNRAPDRAAAVAFVSYLLGKKGQAALAAQGFKLVKPPAVHGSTGKVPASLRSARSG
ncbi:MAG TPA: extracellular solute-binding protein [Acidimicrobiales bacterium]|nr:extracellular solute-binding protein [Acidimicrobiales bacterium]